MRMTGSWKLMVGMVTAAALGVSAAPAAAATVYNVNTTADGNLATGGSDVCASSSTSPANGKCSLRAALEAASNVATGDVTINVPKGTYKLTQFNQLAGETCPGCGLVAANTELEVVGDSDNPNETIAIDGAGAKSTIVDANYTDRAFEIISGTTASISGLTIEHGRPGALGPITSCPKQGGNTPGTAPGGGGGGILDNGVLTLSGDVITDNLVPGYGGGVDNEFDGALVIKDTTISKNSSCDNSSNNNLGGGGVSDDDGAPITISGSTIKFNTVQSPGDGGGVGEENGEPTQDITITRSTISQNRASSGAGVAAESGGTFHLFADLISHNKASNNGGGVFNDGPDTDTYVDTTIADNSASNNGGGLFSCGTDTFQFSTVSDNAAAGGTGNLATGGECPGNVTLDNTIVIRGIGATISFAKAPGAAGTPNASNCNFFGFTDAGYNMFDDTSDSGSQCGSTSGDNDVITAKPKVGTLANNFGPTNTEALLKGSPAIDAANDTACLSETKDSHGKPVDQRYVPRPQGPHCDIGAYEANPNLGLGGSAAKSPIFVGQQDTVNEVIQNNGAEEADNTVFTDPAAGYRIDSVTPSQGTCTHTATTVTCHLGTVLAGGKVTIRIVLTGLTPGTITLRGKVTSNGFDPSPGNNRHKVKIKVKAKVAPKPPRPTVTVASLGSACYRESSTLKIHVKAGAAAGIRTLAVKVAGRTVKTYTFTSHAPRHKSVTVHVHASTLTPGRSYTVSAKVTDTLARSASSSRPVKICKHKPHHGFTG
jgi:hypothetical protein